MNISAEFPTTRRQCYHLQTILSEQVCMHFKHLLFCSDQYMRPQNKWSWFIYYTLGLGSAFFNLLDKEAVDHLQPSLQMEHATKEGLLRNGYNFDLFMINLSFCWHPKHLDTSCLSTWWLSSHIVFINRRRTFAAITGSFQELYHEPKIWKFDWLVSKFYIIDGRCRSRRYCTFSWQKYCCGRWQSFK